MNQQETPWTSDDLEQVYIRINSVSSEYERTRLLLMAYRLHKRNQRDAVPSKIPDSGKTEKKRMSAFIKEAEQRTGLSKTTIYKRLTEAKALEGLDEKVLARVLLSALANKLSDLVRIAAIPKAEIQLDLVNLYDRQRSHAMAKLEKWEAHFKVPKPTAKKKKQAGTEADQSEHKEDAPKDFKDTEKPTVELPDSGVQDNSKLSVAKLAKSGQMEGALRRTKDGFEGDFEIDGKSWRLVVAKNCETFVIVNQSGPSAQLLRPLAKGKVEDGPLTGPKLHEIIHAAIGNAGPPKQQPHGIDVIFRCQGQRWTLSWWPTMSASKKIEVSQHSKSEAIATIRGPWTAADFRRSFLRQFRAQRGAAS